MPQGKMIVRSLIIALLSLCGFGSFSQTQPSTPAPPPQYSSGPVTPYSAASSDSTNVLRLRRSQRYNSPDSDLPELGDQSDLVLIGGGSSHSSADPLPFSQSDAVVVGKVTAGQAYLSEDKRDIYSEFNFAVSDAFKAPSARYIQVGDSIDIERHGGAIRLPSGKIILRCLRDFSMPLVGKRYLLFLKYDPNTEDFHIVTGYQLEGEHTYRLDALVRSDRSNDKLIHPLSDQGETEEQLVNRVKTIKSGNQGGK